LPITGEASFAETTVKPIDPIFDFITVSWNAAAQEAAFEGHCFCMLDTGRMVNSHAMPAGMPHWNRPAYQAVPMYKQALELIVEGTMQDCSPIWTKARV
jgi:hypothetical protein